MKPFIGITSGYSDNNVGVPRTYVKSVEEAGGIPVILPVLRADSLAGELLNGIDGLLLSGGEDLDPKHFDENPLPALGTVSPERDMIELAITRAALEKDVPVLAICRGIQVLNVAAGGTLIQDIATQVEDPIKHRQQAPRWHASHRVTVEARSLLADILDPGENLEVWVNTFHHQAVKEAADGFRVTALAPDGVIEAIEGTNNDFALGVQWHPEGMWEHHPRFLKLFQALVAAARGDSR